jgi:hypothetical protein
MLPRKEGIRDSFQLPTLLLDTASTLLRLDPAVMEIIARIDMKSPLVGGGMSISQMPTEIVEIADLNSTKARRN